MDADARRRRERLERAGRACFTDFALRVVARTTSTQDLVRAAARAGAAAGYTCLAGEQTAGRGRHGRTWVAPPGGALLTSVLLRVRRPPAGVTLAAGLAVADAVARLCGVETRLKWPNDVMAQGGKLAGILAEVEPAAPGPGVAVVLGVGLNLRIDAFPVFAGAPPGVSLHRLTAPAPPPDADDALAELLPALARRVAAFEDGAVPALRREWMARAEGIGRPVVASTPTGRVEGVAVGIDDDGALLVDTTSGRVAVLAGDVAPGGGEVAWSAGPEPG